MAEHLLSQTLDPPAMAISDYYSRGTGCGPNPDDPTYQIGIMVASGEITFDQALDAVVAKPLADADARAKDEPMRDAIARLVVRGDMEFDEALEYLTDARRDMRRLMTEAEAELDGSDLLAARAAVGRCWHDMGDTDGLALKLMDRDIKAGRLDPNDDKAMQAAEDRYERIAREWGKRANWSDAVLAEAPKLREALERVKAQREAVIEAERADLRHVVDWATARRDALSQTMPEIRRDLDPRLADLLGVQPGLPLRREQIAHLLNGRRADGEAIRGKQYARLHQYLDKLTGKTKTRVPLGYVDLCLQADKSVSVAWAGATMRGLHAEAAILLDCHRQAVDATMRYIEQHVATTRAGKRHDGPREQGHLAWVAFEHYSARPTVKIHRTSALGEEYTDLVPLKTAGDPHLHTHVAVPNAVLTESGKVRSFDLDRLAGRVHEFGAFYQAQIATSLRAHGVDVVLDQRTGAARLADITDRVRDAYSKRTVKGTQAAREAAAAQGLDWDKLDPEAKVAAVKRAAQRGREGKADAANPRLGDADVWERRDDLSDWPAWRADAERLGWSYRSVLRPDAVRAMPDQAERTRIAYEAALPLVDEAFQRRARLWDQDIRVLACRGLIASGIVDRSDIDRVTEAFRVDGVRQDGRDTSLTWGKAVDHAGRERTGITTRLHEDQERELIALARAAAADRSAALPQGGGSMRSPKGALDAAISRREAMPVGEGGLRFGTEHGRKQRAAMEHVAEGGRFALVIGAAGAGKSALATPLVDAWRAEGRTVYGLALAWRQTEELAAAGIDDRHRMAVAKFLHPKTLERLDLNARSVVVLDEIGQVGTRQLLTLLRLQAKHGFQLVALGDPRQTQSIESGPVIDLLRKALGPDQVPEILTTIRQRTEREREIAGLFRDGRADEAIAMKRADGTAELVPGDRDAAIRRAADLWRERMEQGRADDPRFSMTVFAATNADVRDINAAIRERKRAMLRADGTPELGADAKTLRVVTRDAGETDLTIAPGDMLRTGSRVFADYGDGKRGFIASNGSVVTVVDVGDRGMTVRANTGREGFVTWDSLRHRMTGEIRLAYGYCQTIHAGQGATADEHIDAMVSGSAAMTGFSAYVSESRHRNRSWMVVSESADREAITNARPIGDPRLIREQDVWDNVARNLSSQPEKESATAFLERAVNVRRRAVQGFQRGRQRAEARRDAGLAPMALRGRLDAMAVRRGLVRAAGAMREQARTVERITQEVVAMAQRMRQERTARHGRGMRL